MFSWTFLTLTITLLSTLPPSASPEPLPSTSPQTPRDHVLDSSFLTQLKPDSADFCSSSVNLWAINSSSTSPPPMTLSPCSLCTITNHLHPHVNIKAHTAKVTRDGAITPLPRAITPLPLTLYMHDDASCAKVCSPLSPKSKPHPNKHQIFTTIETPVFPGRDFSLLVTNSDTHHSVATSVLTKIFSLGAVANSHNVADYVPNVITLLSNAASTKAETKIRTSLAIAHRLISSSPLNVAIGVAPHEMVVPPPYSHLFIPTDLNTLDVTDSDDFEYYFPPNSVSAFIAEHVWEHLALQEAIDALINVRLALKVGGVVRIAVPDRFSYCSNQDNDEAEMHRTDVRDEHLVQYDSGLLSEVFKSAGFASTEITLIEHHTAQGDFLVSVLSDEDPAFQNTNIQRRYSNGRVAPSFSQGKNALAFTTPTLRSTFCKPLHPSTAPLYP